MLSEVQMLNRTTNHLGFKSGVKSGPKSDLAERFYDNGYLIGRGAFSSEEVAQLRGMLSALYQNIDSLKENKFRDIGALNGLDVGTQQPEIDRPTNINPDLLETAIYQKLKNVASEILGRNAKYVFDHVICKMPGTKVKTAWHQDRGYMLDKVELNTVNFWVPLQDTDERNGTLGYVPNSHHGDLMPHGSEGVHPHVRKVELGEIDPVYCKVKAGDFTAHHPLTLHGAGANLSDTPRLAWSVHFGAYGRLEYLRPSNLGPVIKRLTGRDKA